MLLKMSTKKRQKYELNYCKKIATIIHLKNKL